MIRVGFLFSIPATSWLGGANYFRSLLGAINSLPDREIEPVVFLCPRDAAGWKGYFPGTPVIETTLLQKWTLGWALRKAVQALTGREFLLERLLRRHGIALYSHGAGLGSRSPVRSLGWIPDFQHLHLPEFFSEEECRTRNRAYRKACADCDAVLVSSEDARKDLVGFQPDAAPKARLLRFVPQAPALDSLPSRADLEARYGFQGPYFHVPNQFWKHKNHPVVVEALARLRERGIPALVLATGSTTDPRNPAFYAQFTAALEAQGLQGAFRPLGVIPYADMLGLLVHAEAVINPSLFEGWSTTVEEAKLFGVRLILSDLPVHREQAPPNGRYFDPQDAGALADHMAAVLQDPGHGAEPDRAGEAYRAFGRAYQAIVLELLTPPGR